MSKSGLTKNFTDLAGELRRDGFIPGIRRLLAHDVVRYLILTVLSLILVVSVTSALHEWFGVWLDGAYGVGLVSAFVLNFLGMRYYVYGGPTRPFLVQLGGFSLSTIGFRVLEYFAFSIVHGWFGAYYALAILLVQGTSFVAKFILYRFVLFGNRS